jgi:hypothetical protein
MNAFIIEMENRPGELARVAAAIGEKGINITNGAGIAVGSSGAFGVTTNDEDGTRSALDDLGCRYREVELIPITLDDRPGTLAGATRRLADAGVNIEFLVPAGMSGGRMTVAFGVDDAAKARSALGELATAMA